MITIQIEKFSQFMSEFDVLCREHWDEVARNKDFIPLSPDYEQYLKLDEANILCCSTAREDKKLIGYCINIVMPHLHYSKSIIGINDLLFLTKSKRGNFIGAELLKAAMKEMKQRGAEVFTMHAKIEHDIKPLMDRLNFTAIETIYEKVL